MLFLTLFFYGFLAACASLLLQIITIILFGENSLAISPSFLVLMVAAFIEEGMKLAFLLQAFRRFGDTVLTPLFLIVFGFGFSAIELGFAFALEQPLANQFPLVGMNILLHLVTVLVLGIGLKRFPFPSRSLIVLFTLVTLFHCGYNFLRLQG